MSSLGLSEVPITEGNLYVITGGNRYPVAEFNGYIDIVEDEVIVPVLGTLTKRPKTIKAYFVVCADLKYDRAHDESRISSANVFEAVGNIQGRNKILAGMRFEDSDPIKGELRFSIPDLRLIEELLER